MWSICLTNFIRTHFLLLFFLKDIQPSSQIDELGADFSPIDLKTARDNALKQVNLYRKWHNSPLVSLDEKLNTASQTSAEDHIKKQTFEADLKTSEVIFIRYNKNKTPFNISEYAIHSVATWYLQLCKISFKMTGETELSRVLYKESKSFGIGFAQNKKGTMLKIVAQFLPGGNAVTRKTYKEPKCPNIMEICERKLRREIVRGLGRCAKKGMGLKSWGDADSEF